MSRDDYTPRGLSDPESHLDLAGQRQRPQVDTGTGSEAVAPSPNHQGRHVTLNAIVEVDMLRHKLRALENLVERYGTLCSAFHHFGALSPRFLSSTVCGEYTESYLILPCVGISSHIPSLSEAEEARALQYRCECLEAACMQQSK